MNNLLNSIKKHWVDYLERLAKANEKTFGNRRPDCCDLNRIQNNSYRNNVNP